MSMELDIILYNLVYSIFPPLRSRLPDCEELSLLPWNRALIHLLVYILLLCVDGEGMSLSLFCCCGSLLVGSRFFELRLLPPFLIFLPNYPILSPRPPLFPSPLLSHFLHFPPIFTHPLPLPHSLLNSLTFLPFFPMLVFLHSSPLLSHFLHFPPIFPHPLPLPHYFLNSLTFPPFFPILRCLHSLPLLSQYLRYLRFRSVFPQFSQVTHAFPQFSHIFPNYLTSP